MSDGSRFHHESVKDLGSIARYLTALTEGLAAGRLELSSDGRTLVLAPHGLLELEIEARRRAGRSRVVVRVSWRDDDLPPEDVARDDLAIRAGGGQPDAREPQR